ncbi:DUF3069 domain-containing protein [Vibrio mangrovi]|uniref:DUF3069 domain-containing protein n=1 Tax=Vibrio mangrovi TaxID=474394 RepID=A0A1Y6IWZ5_9VIBR|nr:DUF3069 domain-containing protein [Vibrio mangrovi]MDW6005371.1 DUF3069 domain-containing protein [Vibrio mangrovi]SMS02189.1 hypothetical protein VIM7927_03507 [Vibrio mangrovi]
MSDTTQSQEPQVQLDELSPELRQVILFDDVPQEMFTMIASIHEVSEEAVRESWNSLPASAQNILDNFEQFHALISVSQAFAGIETMEEIAGIDLPESMDDKAKEDYRAQMLDQVLSQCVKDMVKQLKKARRDPILKREFTDVFQSHETQPQ